MQEPFDASHGETIGRRYCASISSHYIGRWNESGNN